MLKSCLCTQRQLESPAFRRWAGEMGTGYWMHRKLWEWCYIAQALAERGKLRPGMRGLGFAVGREPLVALFARYGCEVVATDLPADDPASAGWAATGQHAGAVDELNPHGVCPPEQFRRLVSLQRVDMTAIPDDLTGFDFCWSACAIEHVGSLDLSKLTFLNLVGCLKPGGVGVHTAEYNVSADVETIVTGPTVLWRRRDVEHVAEELRKRCHRLAAADFDPGDGPLDRLVNEHPEVPDDRAPGLKLRAGKYVATSVGLIVERDGWLRRSLWERVTHGGAARLRKALRLRA